MVRRLEIRNKRSTEFFEDSFTDSFSISPLLISLHVKKHFLKNFLKNHPDRDARLSSPKIHAVDLNYYPGLALDWRRITELKTYQWDFKSFAASRTFPRTTAGSCAARERERDERQVLLSEGFYESRRHAEER